MACGNCGAKNIYGAPSMHGPKCGCPECGVPDRDVQFYGNGFGLGITPGMTPGESFLFGNKIVGWQGDTPMTMDPQTGQLFAHMLNMTTGAYMPGVAMPTTIAARGGGMGPIATAPTGSGRVFWAPDMNTVGSAIFTFGILTLAIGGLYMLLNMEISRAGETGRSRAPMTRGGLVREKSHLVV